MVELLDLLIPIFLALLSYLAFAFFLKLLGKKKSHSNLEGSMGWPLWGETFEYLKPHTSNSLGSFLQERCSRYGKVFKSNILGSPTVISCDYELNMFILKNEHNLFPSNYPRAMQNILGKTFITFARGDDHKKLRTVVINFVNAAKFGTEFPRIVEVHVLSMLESWKDCKQVAFHTAAKKFSMNIMLKNVLSIDPDHPISSKFYKSFEQFIEGFLSLPLRLPGTAYSNAIKAKANVCSIIKEIIEERRKGINDIMAADDGVGGDFLGATLSNQSLCDEERVELVLGFIYGAFETTAKLFSLLVYFVGQAPHVLEILKEEHQCIRKSKRKEEGLGREDMKKMKFTMNVIHEALRCGNIIKNVLRKAAQEVRYQDIVIPAGWKVLPMLTAQHLDDNVYENPFEFNPLRWDINISKRENLSPFGGGPRLCPGIDLAKMEAAFFLHHLVLNYRWKLKANDDPPIAYPHVEFSKGLHVEFEFINNTSA